MDDSRSTSTSSGKRKRSGPAFYAVRAGHKPGVYLNWEDTQKQVAGFKNASCKKFTSYPEAEAYVKGDETVNTKSSKQKHYAVQQGRVPGVYDTWEEAKQQVDGWKPVKHKSFATRAEAEAFVAAGSRAITISTFNTPINGKEEVDSEASMALARKGCKVGESAAKKQKKNNGTPLAVVINGDMEPGTGPLPPDAEDGMDPTILFNAATGFINHKSEAQQNAKKLQPTGEFSGPIHVYTDGSSLGNGSVGAVAGVGIYFGANDPRNVSEPLAGARQTNQRAELDAIRRALDIVPIDKAAIIYTDSNYAIKSCTAWLGKWLENNWRNAAGKPVDNRDIIEPTVNRIEERKKVGATTDFVWVKGHNYNEGNMAADALAVSAAREAQISFAMAVKETNGALEGL
ncbi:ribonuclease H-like protein [Lojkania enalia]|uniref:ribonuclease H n=1 Tax=Lojkania enalia TaxID=147567 RepID=A0A9P4N998_9PLEO|nr:ribonuclease H-like protein [Didymosphaeria enalia]